ncbi:MAG TPA: hypothetical protein VFK70_08465 [Vicinamibacteria bacterium]|nr:hypothetical protein [Vicinamibacteria bacterium]
MADTRKTVIVAAGSVGVTGAIVVLVFSLAGWAYRHREISLHDGRLRDAVAKHPTIAQVSLGILAEPGNRALPTPASEDELRRLVAQYPGGEADQILAKRRRWRDMRVFEARAVVYFLYFDEAGALQDYELARR